MTDNLQPLRYFFRTIPSYVRYIEIPNNIGFVDLGFGIARFGLFEKEPNAIDAFIQQLQTKKFPYILDDHQKERRYLHRWYKKGYQSDNMAFSSGSLRSDYLLDLMQKDMSRVKSAIINSFNTYHRFDVEEQENFFQQHLMKEMERTLE